MSIQKSKPVPSPTPSLRQAVIAAIVITLAAGFSEASIAETPSVSLVQAGQNASPDIDARQHRKEQWLAHRSAFMQKNLDEMSSRLQITASEQPAWDQYKAARMAMLDQGFWQPGANMNAANLAKLNAERSERMAKKTAVMSQATSTLRAELTPSQQQVMDEMAHERHMKHFGRHGRKPGLNNGATPGPIGHAMQP